MALSSFQLRQKVDVGTDVYVFKLGCNCNGTAIAVATSEHDICVLDPATLVPVRSLRGHADIVEDLTFFQNEPAGLASCSHDGSARLWDLRVADAESRHFAVSSREVYSCSLGRDDGILACAASEKVCIFDVAQSKRRCTYKDCHTDVVNHLRFHPVDTRKLLSGAEDNLIVVLDTDHTREDEAIVGVIPSEECVRSFTLVGPDRNTLCCVATTDDLRIYGLGEEDFGIRRAEFLSLRQSPLLSREDSGGYIIETFYDQPSSQVLLLAGAGNEGELMLFRVTLEETAPVAAFLAPRGLAGGHSGIVRSALCLGGVVFTAGEDGRICAWREGPGDEAEAGASEAASGRFELETTSYGAQRTAERQKAAHPAPY